MLLDPGTVTHQSIGIFLLFLTGYCSILGTSSQSFFTTFYILPYSYCRAKRNLYNHFIFGDKGVHTYGRINIWKYI